ncbi:MAG: hypothetical protein HQ512_11860 [Rhodospirillales bacterium]|nr:hypothetical protein [Rhodospirillales bacterium]
MVRSGLKTAILVVALSFQMLPFFMLLVVVAHTLGVTGGGLLVMAPICFFVMVGAACWLASKRASISPRPSPAWIQPRERRGPNRSRQDTAVLMKSRAEHYQDLREILGRAWR